MIKITRLNGQPFVLNALYIEKIESLPDTTITLVNGKKHFVRESVSEVVNTVNDYYQKIGLINLTEKEGVEDE
ncbi:flagellar FlbD family protein [Piscibacillus halophilus]|mgnify:CR=1 FL=1|uniref:Flagellar protein FlbD n=1 Tax=Piscibacillus halophilus TaxID=571933 RepID=A0A1H8YYI9_9BACI|nr:flagellar FlbD family protein [Piscibacillus halophilus]SEP57270.1 flagellar protein FlbD [Piscibacillus halophilus]